MLFSSTTHCIAYLKYVHCDVHYYGRVGYAYYWQGRCVHWKSIGDSTVV